MRPPAAVALMLALAGCAGPGRAARAADAWIELRCAAPGARAYLDERPLGPVARLGRLAVGAGAHRVEVQAPGRFSVYRDVMVAHGAGAALEVELHELPEDESGP